MNQPSTGIQVDLGQQRAILAVPTVVVPCEPWNIVAQRPHAMTLHTATAVEGVERRLGLIVGRGKQRAAGARQEVAVRIGLDGGEVGLKPDLLVVGVVFAATQRAREIGRTGMIGITIRPELLIARPVKARVICPEAASEGRQLRPRRPLKRGRQSKGLRTKVSLTEAAVVVDVRIAVVTPLALQKVAGAGAAGRDRFEGAEQYRVTQVQVANLAGKGDVVGVGGPRDGGVGGRGRVHRVEVVWDQLALDAWVGRKGY